MFDTRSDLDSRFWYFFDNNFLNLTGAVRDMSDNVQATYCWLADGIKVGVKNPGMTAMHEVT